MAQEREPRPLDFAWPQECMERLKAEFRRYGYEVTERRVTVESMT